jgi:hypothetical protein
MSISEHGWKILRKLKPGGRNAGQEAVKMSWGGYSGHFKAPEGHLGQSPYMQPY